MADQTQETKLAKKLGNKKIGDELRQQILQYADEETLVIVSSNLAAVVGHRSEYGSTGGIGYYSQVRVFYGSQSEMQEWQWRDRYSADRDKPWLSVRSIGKMKVSEKDNKVVVEVELVNKQHGNRNATFFFKPITGTAPTQVLSTKEQATFCDKWVNERIRIMAEFEQMWKRKPTMPGRTSYVSYYQPRIKQQEFRPDIGVGAFVIEEQIDHDVHDRQMRHELFVMTHTDKKAKSVAEDHGYEREGGAFLQILEITPTGIVVNTKRGKSTISLKEK